MNFQAQEQRREVWQCTECGTVKEAASAGGGFMAVFACNTCSERQVFERATEQ